jgi:geranylgeranyl pyrophosphate synthase
MQKHDSIEYTKWFARRIVKTSWNNADVLLPASEAKGKLKAFAEFLIERKI